MEATIDIPVNGRYVLSYDPAVVKKHTVALVTSIKAHRSVNSQEALDILAQMQNEIMLRVAWDHPEIFTVRDISHEAEKEARAKELARRAHINQLLSDARAGDAAAALEFCKNFNPHDWWSSPCA